MLLSMLKLESSCCARFGGLAIAGALLLACGDDDVGPGAGSGGRSGSGGSAGAAGAAGSAGASGAAGSAGVSGSGGAGGSGGSGGSGGVPDGGAEPPPCRDCVELRVPVDDSDQTALFTFEGGPFDMSDATITFRMRPLTRGDQLVASPFARDTDGQGFASTDTPLRESTFPEETWVSIGFGLSGISPPGLVRPGDAGPLDGDAGVDAGVLVPDPTAFDKSRVTRFGLKVGSSPDYAGRAATVVVLVDTVSFQGIAGNPLAEKSFDANVEGMRIDLEASTPGAELIHHPAD